MKINDFYFNLRGLRWKVHFVDTCKEVGEFGLKNKIDDESPEAYGITYTHVQTIVIAKAVSLGYLKVTFFHELNHAIMDVLRLDGGGQANEEVIVDILASAYVEVLPQLPKWLVQKSFEGSDGKVLLSFTKGDK
jgi:hypothetical protein